MQVSTTRHLTLRCDGLLADHAGNADSIEVSADHQSAVGHYDHVVEFEIVLPRESTLAQMAHAQGHGVLRRTERRQLAVRYTKTQGRWKIAQVRLATPRGVAEGKLVIATCT